MSMMRVVSGEMMVIRPCNMLHGTTKNLVVANHSVPPQSVAVQDGRQLTMSVSSLQQLALLKSTSSKKYMQSLPEKWMEYQGINNWEGLVDPLDEGLRDEILRYGDFVEAAYRAFDFDTSSPSFATCRYPTKTMLAKCGFGNSGYKVIKDLHATCAVQVPRWTKHVPSWVSTKSSWIGYVAVSDDQAEIKRLGRRDVVIAYRGTATCLEWLENLRATLSPLPDDMAPSNHEPMVQSGFLSLYTSGNTNSPSLQNSVRKQIGKILEIYGDEPLSITITGHSLGAALATLTAYDIATTFKHAPLVTVVSFGSPRVGNKCFRTQLERSGTKVLRIVNSDDPVTKVPGFVVDETDNSRSGVTNWLQTQWEYAEVGEELRLNSKDSPYIKKGGVATCHDLKTYLHLVNNMSSTCPIRPAAKKMLQRTKHDDKQLIFS
ncbi:phospholipase [Lithospermum erythrorhizon]|uniref:Phospholipase n=1 Tax=Lithospermum erythrorhizon TaxID=34254 RepID=A0AAV3R7Y2_LITER